MALKAMAITSTLSVDAEKTPKETSSSTEVTGQITGSNWRSPHHKAITFHFKAFSFHVETFKRLVLGSQKDLIGQSAQSAQSQTPLPI